MICTHTYGTYIYIWCIKLFAFVSNNNSEAVYTAFNTFLHESYLLVKKKTVSSCWEPWVAGHKKQYMHSICIIYFVAISQSLLLDICM